MAYVIREYEPEKDKDAVVAVMSDVWGESTVSRFLDQYDWNQDYHNTVAPYLYKDIVIHKEGVIVGYTRVMSVAYKLGDNIVAAVNLADNVTHSKHRGCGVKLLRHITLENERLEIGAPVARAAILWGKIVKRDVLIKKITRNVLMVKPSVFLQKKGVPIQLGAIVDYVWKFKLAWLGRINHRNAFETPIDVSHSAKPPTKAEYEDLMKVFSMGFYAIALREYKYFLWRFFSSQSNYKCMWLKENGRLIGYCIYRQCYLNGRNVLLVVDIVAIGNKTAAYSEMIRQLISLSFKSGYADIQAIDTGCKDLESVLKSMGCVSKIEKINLLAYIASDQPYALEMYENKNWYMSLADGDYEFVMYPYERNNGE